MLDYTKTILLKVSFSKALFEKELRKALQRILPAEVSGFMAWCYEQFARLYWVVLNRVFAQHRAAVALAATPIAASYPSN